MKRAPGGEIHHRHERCDYSTITVALVLLRLHDGGGRIFTQQLRVDVMLRSDHSMDGCSVKICRGAGSPELKSQGRGAHSIV